jgi:hypothetical protein
METADVEEQPAPAPAPRRASKANGAEPMTIASA